MKNFIEHVLTSSFFLVFVTIGLFSWPTVLGASGAPVAVIDAECESMTGAAGGGVLILAKQNRLMKVLPTGKVEKLTIPQLPPEYATVQFRDCSLSGDRLTFCSDDTSNLFSLDMKDPSSWSIINVKMPTGTTPQFGRIFTQKDAFLVDDAGGTPWRILSSGEAAPMASDSILHSSIKADANLSLRTEQTDGKTVWTVLDASGKQILQRRPPSPDKLVRNLEVLGLDSRDRLVFIELVGSTEFDNVLTLYASREGQIEFSLLLENPGRALVAKPQVLAADDSVWLMYPSAIGSGVQLLRVDVKGGAR